MIRVRGIAPGTSLSYFWPAPRTWRGKPVLHRGEKWVSPASTVTAECEAREARNVRVLQRLAWLTGRGWVPCCTYICSLAHSLSRASQTILGFTNSTRPATHNSQLTPNPHTQTQAYPNNGRNLHSHPAPANPPRPVSPAVVPRGRARLPDLPRRHEHRRPVGAVWRRRDG